uniref:triacylglycerol lipase n=1 Tax=Graphocephala atropunctata TaxID=36148 RepID=A0A1B6L7K1_9HEMI
MTATPQPQINRNFRSLHSENSVNRRTNRKMNLSFAGCGFLGIYHVGVAVCFKKYAPHILLNRISGASAGGIAACFLLCDLPISAVTSDVLNLVCLARKRTLGPFSPNFNVQDVLAAGLRKNLPEDAHLKVSGKLHISLTSLPGFKNVIVSKFYSKEDLIQALLASAFVPFFSGSHPPKFHGSYYMDGGFSNNLVTLDENTITVSPFCGETDICPRDTSSQLFHVNLANTSIEVSRQNIYRFARILYPPNPEVLTKLCVQGFHDALSFLQNNNLIKCSSYIAVESTFLVSKYRDTEEIEHDPECQDCLRQREEAQNATLPDSVVKVFQEATEATKKGLINWLYQFRGMKLLSFMMLPYTLPIEIAYATVSKLLMPTNFLLFVEFIMDQLEHFLHIKSEPPIDCVACTCQLTDPEFCGFGLTKEMLDEMDMYERDYSSSSEKEEDDQSRTTLSDEKDQEWKLRDCDVLADDTFENILKVTSHHDSVVSFYYMPSKDKMRIEEIYELSALEVKQLSENKESQVDLVEWLEQQERQMKGDLELSRTETSDEETIMFSDPESDWTEPSDSDISDLRPESDQRHKKTRKLSRN